MWDTFYYWKISSWKCFSLGAEDIIWQKRTNKKYLWLSLLMHILFYNLPLFTLSALQKGIWFELIKLYTSIFPDEIKKCLPQAINPLAAIATTETGGNQWRKKIYEYFFTFHKCFFSINPTIDALFSNRVYCFGN